jgi:hypothetical protein
VSTQSFDPRPFIDRADWRFSKTTAEWPDWKHWYAVESQHADDPDFARFVKLIEAEGYDARFEGHAYRYLRVDDFLYWTSRSLYAPGQNLNRRPAADVEGRAEHEQGRLPV